jgi:hypothetical protein
MGRIAVLVADSRNPPGAVLGATGQLLLAASAWEAVARRPAAMGKMRCNTKLLGGWRSTAGVTRLRKSPECSPVLPRPRRLP